MKLTYLAHSCFLLETGSHRLLIDPFLTGNSLAATKADEVECDFIVLSHGHEDHVGDAVPIARRTGATIIGPFELAEYCGAQGVNAFSMNHGGAAAFPFGRLKLTPAIHSSSLGPVTQPIYLGAPAGLLIETGGRRVYHAGDTALFSDMQLIGRGGLDAALLPIGDTYTMGIEDAVAALDYLRPRLAVPMHYNTFPPIQADPQRFAALAAKAGHAVRVLAPGQSCEL